MLLDNLDVSEILEHMVIEALRIIVNELVVTEL
jgi:hypothetical protein